jgi:hypothetical protein
MPYNGFDGARVMLDTATAACSFPLLALYLAPLARAKHSHREWHYLR